MADIVDLRAWRPTNSARPRAGSRPVPLWRELVGDCLRDERRTQGRRLVDVADRAGVSMQYLSEIERGRKEPSSEVLAAVAGALDLTIHDLAAHVASRANPSAHDGQCLAA